MRKYKKLIEIVVASMMFFLMGVQVYAQNKSVTYKGVEFPLGNKSFADKLVGFNFGSESGEKDGAAAIGFPDAGKGTGPSIIGHKGDVTLGRGGNIILKFTDNYLIDVKGLDLYIFEAGPSVEAFKVEISKDGSTWIDLGVISGQPTGLDINAKVTPGDRFSYVRISDPVPYVPRDPKTIGQPLYFGADIDAVGAIGAEEKRDSDGDGIPDGDDQCVGTLVGTEVDQNGCPVVNTTQAQNEVMINNNQNTFSCANKDNEEKGCCCFKGTHTYLFASHYVGNVLTQFDTGKKINCKSTVTFEVRQGDQWSSIKQFQANSSKNGSEVNLVDVVVPVNKKINGFRISDGCVCCLDTSKIYLNTNKLPNNTSNINLNIENKATYLGCYIDKSDRDIKGYHFESAQMTNQMCINKCSEKGFGVAATQFSKECFCGDTYGKYGMAPKQADCKYACKGNPKTNCGGYWRNSVYQSRAGSSKPPLKEPSKQTVCASAEPSITDGSAFKSATFTIRGTAPQEVRIIRSTENFAIAKEEGGVIFRMVKGQSWGSLTLNPGIYILSCNGGGAMELMSARVCIEYPGAGGMANIDSDGDGISDGDDQCADTAAGTMVDLYGCPVDSVEPTPTPISTLDSDGDGVSDADDQCRDTLIGIAVDPYGCPVVSPEPTPTPISTLDSDGDGISDGDDQCAGTLSGIKVDKYGCPVVSSPSISCNWTGTWDTSWGKMELAQAGDSERGAEVTGTASLAFATRGSSNPEKGNIQSIVMGDKLSGAWLKRPSYGPPKDAGDILLIISKDCNSFKGKWRYGYGRGNWDGDWTGSRAGSSKPPAKEPLKETICASANPSITGGGQFKPTTFIIGGTEPQKISIVESADNFSIRKKDVWDGGVYLSFKGKRSGSLVLEPGTYDLYCSGGGAMGLASDRVCIGYHVVGDTPPSGGQIDPPKSGKKDKKNKPIIGKDEPSLPIGPAERVIIRPHDDLTATKLTMKIGDKKRFVAWGVDAAGKRTSDKVVDWDVRGKIDESISDNGKFETGSSENVVTIFATVKNEDGDYITGAFTIMISAVEPVIFRGCVKLYDENGRPFPSKGAKVSLEGTSYNSLKDLNQEWNGYWCTSMSTQANSKGKFQFVVPGADCSPPFVSWEWTLSSASAAPSGYQWTHTSKSPLSNEAEYHGPIKLNKPIFVEPKGFKCFELELEAIIFAIKGKILRHGKPVKKIEVQLLHNGQVERRDTSDDNGEYSLDVTNLKKGNYQLRLKSPKITTIHNRLDMKDIFIDLPLKNGTKTINIKMILWKDKVGNTRP